MTKTASDRLTKAILETSEGMRRIGVMDDATHEKITLRHLGEKAVSTAAPISGDEIRSIRERAHLSQAVFARYLNLTVGYISQLERGAKPQESPHFDLSARRI